MKIDFEFDTPYGLFRDALHLSDSHSFSDAEIQSMKTQRVDDWVALLENPPVEEATSEFIEIDGVQYAKVV